MKSKKKKNLKENKKSKQKTATATTKTNNNRVIFTLELQPDRITSRFVITITLCNTYAICNNSPSYFVILDTLCNTLLSHFLIPDALCNKP